MRESGRQRERWVMQGSPSSTQQGNDQGVPMKKCLQPRRESFKKIVVQCLVLTQDKELYSIPPDRTTPNSWAIGKNIEKTLVTVLGISNSRLTYLKNQERKIHRDQTIYKSLECTPDKSQEDW